MHLMPVETLSNETHSIFLCLAKLLGKNDNDLPSATWVAGVKKGRLQEATHPGIPKQTLLCIEYRFLGSFKELVVMIRE